MAAHMNGTLLTSVLNKGFELATNFHDSVGIYQFQDFSGAAVSKYKEEAPDKLARRLSDLWLRVIHLTKLQQLDYDFPLINWRPTCVEEMPIVVWAGFAIYDSR